jgi:hypothetical protein
MTNQEVLTTQILIINHLVQLLYNLVAFGFFFSFPPSSVYSCNTYCFVSQVKDIEASRLLLFLAYSSL